MFKSIFARTRQSQDSSPVHDCEQEQRFEPSWNRAVARFGTVWQCPDCKAFWYRKIEFINALLNDNRPVWRRLTKRQVRRLQILVCSGHTQQEIAEKMNFTRPDKPGDDYDQPSLEWSDKCAQDPNSWVFP